MKTMKRAWLPIVLTLILLFSGCASVKDAIGIGDDKSEEDVPSQSVTDKISDFLDNSMKETFADEEEIYSRLSSLISYPEGSAGVLDSKFSFVAVLLGDIEEMEFDDAESGLYYPAYISRNEDDFFYIEASAIEQEFHEGDMVKVTGSLNGTIYWTEDNEQVEVLDVMASAMEAYEPEAIEPDYSGIALDKNGNEIELYGAHATKDSFNDAIIVYFTYKNNGSDSSAPSLGQYYVEYNGEQVGTTIFSIDEVDAGALEASGAGLTTETYAGKTQLYYAAFSVPGGLVEDEPIYFLIYDDEFRLTDGCALTVFPSLEEYYAAGEDTTDEVEGVDAPEAPDAPDTGDDAAV